MPAMGRPRTPPKQIVLSLQVPPRGLFRVFSILERAQRALRLSEPQPELARSFVDDALERLRSMLAEQNDTLDAFAHDPSGDGIDPWGASGSRPKPDVNGDG